MGEVIKRSKNGKFLGYYLRFYEGGRRRVIASKQTSHSDAKRMLAEIEARVARGEVGITERRTGYPAVAQLIEQFLSEYQRPKLKDMEQYRKQARAVLKNALPHIGKLSAGQITQSDVVKMRDALLRKLAKGTVYNVLTKLSAMFAWAVREQLARQNPCKGVERPASAHSIDYLGREEARALLDGAELRMSSLAGNMLYVGIALGVHTGMRKGEIFGLRWIDLDLDTRRLTVARSYQTTPKSGKTRHLRLPAVLVPILQKWKTRCPQSREGLVIPLGRNDAKQCGDHAMLGLPKLMAELGLRPVLHPWHLLRHTFASHFVMNGGNILALQKILGHSDVKMTMIYAHLAPDFLEGEMDKVRY